MNAIRTWGLVMALSLTFSACSAAQNASVDGKRVSANQSILASSRPAEGATVRGPLNSLELTFTRPAALAEVTITGSDGTTMPTMVTPVGEVTHYSLPLPGLEAGRYSVVWRARARGVEYRGDFAFTVQ
ncbi:MAG: copper resistance protein CopC [Pseudomonadota bacterium]|nr:copper resistance protein CopC [Pseudomonadota bacterium]